MTERLRIALVAPLAHPVTSTSTSSIELLVWLLAEELGRRGHEVTLWATGDSQTSARLQYSYRHGYAHDQELWNWEFHETRHLAAAFENAHQVDIIHTHVYHFLPPLARLVDVPVVHTDHVLANRDVLDAYADYPELHVAALSNYHRRKLASKAQVTVVPNGIDTDSFPFGAQPDDYLLFLGHLTRKKGPLDAIAVARQAGMRLVLAGRGGRHFQDEVAPLIDGDRVVYVGPVGVEERNTLLAKAAALVFPSAFLEPFGLVLVEAMACGTPVAAIDRCAVPEIVIPGVTGYHAPGPDALVERLPDVLRLDRARVRAEVARRFDYRRMVDGYEALYHRLVMERRGSVPALQGGGARGAGGGGG